MGDIFEEFINQNPNLAFLNGEKKPIIRDGISDYVDELIVKYGLIPDKEARLVLINVIRRYYDITNRFMPQLHKQYLMILLWDIITKDKRPLSVAWNSLLIGVSFGELVDWEDVEPPSE